MPLGVAMVHEDGTRSGLAIVEEGKPILMPMWPDDGSAHEMLLAILPEARAEAFIQYIEFGSVLPTLQLLDEKFENYENFDIVLQPDERHQTPMVTEAGITSAFEIRHLGNQVLGMALQ